ncbi:HU family DNA-binding protein [Sphingomonas sp. SUN019]|nr:HU family DNA-binding protein [Sphingomonas sp. SUN019]
MVEFVAAEIGSPTVADDMVKCLFSTMVAHFEKGGRVELRKFGSFSVRSYRGRNARNPATGEFVTVSPKCRVHFKPSRQLTASLAAGAALA